MVVSPINMVEISGKVLILYDTLFSGFHSINVTTPVDSNNSVTFNSGVTITGPKFNYGRIVTVILLGHSKLITYFSSLKLMWAGGRHFWRVMVIKITMEGNGHRNGILLVQMELHVVGNQVGGG